MVFVISFSDPGMPFSRASSDKIGRPVKTRLPPKRGQVRISAFTIFTRRMIIKGKGRRAIAAPGPEPIAEAITEAILIEDCELERKRYSGIRICAEQQEQSEKKQQEDQPPPGPAGSYISQVEASPLCRPLPPLSLPLASKARPSSSPVSHPSQGTMDQMQATPDWAPELSFPLTSLSLCTFQTQSLADMLAQSSISGGACLFMDMKLREEGPEGHDQLYESAVHHLLSGIDGIGELKRRYDLRAGGQASRLKETEDTIIMLLKQVEELEARVSMANMSERRLMDMLCISEDRHDRTKRELALMREKMDEANHWIEYLEAAVSRYQNRIVVAEIEKEKAEESASRASVEGEAISTSRPSPAAPGCASLSFVPSLT